MTLKEKRDFFLKMEKAFREEPDIEKYNSEGLCDYPFGYTEEYEEYKAYDNLLHEHLEKEFPDICTLEYEFAFSGFPQYRIYNEKMTNLYYERADWCAKIADYYQMLIDNRTGTPLTVEMLLFALKTCMTTAGQAGTCACERVISYDKFVRVLKSIQTNVK